MKWFYEIKCLTIFGDREAIYRHIIFFWLVSTVVIAFYTRFKKVSNRKFLLPDIFLVAFIISTIAYFIIPLNASVGLISWRLFYFLIIFLLLWIAMQIGNVKIALPLAAIVLTIHFFLFFNIHFSLLTTLNNDAFEMQKASAFIKPNSVVFPYNLESKPLEGSISNVLGFDKPLLVLEWYEPDFGWFAVNRTINKVPKLRIHAFPNYRLAWTDNTTNKVIAWIDYVIVFGDYYSALASGRTNMQEFVPGYTRIYSSDDNRIHILKSNQ